jgi:hypothetical protein
VDRGVGSPQFPRAHPIPAHTRSQFQIPALSLLDVNFAMPVVAEEVTGTGDKCLVAYIGLNPVVLPPPGTGRFSRRSIGWTKRTCSRRRST